MIELTHKKKLMIFKIIMVCLALILGAHLKYYYKVPDIDMRVIASAIGIDKTEDGQIKVSAHILIPVAAAGSESIKEYAEATGETVSIALNKLNVVTGAQVETLQCGMLILGERLCEDGVMEHLKSIHSAGRVKAGVLLVAADKMQASEYLKAELKTADEPANRMENLITYFENTLNMPNLTLVKFLGSTVGESNCSYMPFITLDVPSQESEQEGEGGGQQGEAKSMSSEQGSDPEKTTKFKSVSKTAVFLDGKKIAVLDEKATRGIIFTEKISNKGYINLDSFTYGNKNYGSLAGDIIATKSKLNVCFIDEMPHVTFSVRADIELRERYPFTPELDGGLVNEKDFYKKLSEAFAASIQQDIESAVQSQKQINADFLQLKYRFARLQSKNLAYYNKLFEGRFNQDFAYDFDIKCKVK